MARREVFEKVGMFDETGKYGDWVGGALDTALWLRIAEKYKVGIINKRLIYRRVSRASGSGQYVSTTTKRANHFTVLDDFLNSPALSEPIGAAILAQYEFNKFWDDVFIAKNLVKCGRGKKAAGHLAGAVSWKIFFTGFKSVGNLERMAIFFVFLFLSSVGLAGAAIKSVKYLRDGYGRIRRRKIVY